MSLLSGVSRRSSRSPYLLSVILSTAALPLWLTDIQAMSASGSVVKAKAPVLPPVQFDIFVTN